MTRSRFRWDRTLLALLAVAGVGIGGWFAFGRGKAAFGGQAVRAPEEGASSGSVVRVEAVHPSPGGIRRMSVQPGTVEPFESADLYAKASGFLIEQAVDVGGVKQRVDIGTHVKQGDVLARLSVPEYEKAVQRDAARVKDANAKIKQMEAHRDAAKAEAKAAEASVTLARVLIRAKGHYRAYREKQLNRIKELVISKALDERTQDEQEEFYLSALESENAAREQLNTAVEHATQARAKIEQAEADVAAAKAGVEVAAAELERSQALLDYTVIKSPYTGVVTKRSFHVGDFIRSADQGGNVPLLAVERTDVMRVVVRVPDLDVTYVSLGDPAVVEIDALPGAVFQTAGDAKVGVSRWSESEDPQTRTMRTEIDVPNPDGRLRHGMYGRVTLTLAEGTPNSVRVPSAALVGKAEGGRGSVRVVRDGTARLVPVRFATDNGIEVEVVSGLTAADLVVVRASGPVEDGTPVALGGGESH